MSRWLSHVRMAVLVLAFAGSLAHCGGGDDDGGGGGNGNLVRLFFGMNGLGECDNVTVEVDLADADAILARDDDDTVDCGLDPGLTAKGCDVSFTEILNGDRLRVVISGCTIPGSTNLFVCGFTDVDISDIEAESDAICTCVTPGCDRTPPLCIDGNIDPKSCEDCDDNRDNDGNGLTDCSDPNCEHLPPCTDPTVTTTTVSSTTTTIESEPLLVHFRLTSAADPVGALQITVNYASAPGQMVGEGEDVECTNRVTGAIFEANDRDSIKRINFGWASIAGFNAPTNLVTCEFDPDTPVPVPSNFTIVVNEAVDPDGERTNVQIGVSIEQQ